MKTSSTKKKNAKQGTKRWQTVNEMVASLDGANGPQALARALAKHAEEIDQNLSMLHAAALHMQGEFVVPPSEACEVIEGAIASIRFETAQMRRPILKCSPDSKRGAA